jgi:hypothetical protein
VRRTASNTDCPEPNALPPTPNPQYPSDIKKSLVIAEPFNNMEIMMI